ncbi:MAG TPA: hypothetical protein VNT01_12800 [Symbiobacteriaceae bacterium]|nr:hypothetical protein [Symbiobacteriaceae bacterium]
MQQLSNPNGKLASIFAVVTVVGLVAGIAGFMSGSDTALAIGIIGAVLALTGAIAAPMLWSTGRKQVVEIAALLSGQGLLAHWTFDPDEWSRYTQNEYDRGMKQTRQLGVWTLVGVLVLILAIAWFGDAFTGVTFALALGVAALFAALLAGSSYLITKSAHAANRAGVGEVFIGGTCIYFGKRFYTWKGAWAALEKVAFETGDPCVVQYNIKYGSGDNTSHQEVRIPVPRGREQEAQDLVGSYYAAS